MKQVILVWMMFIAGVAFIARDRAAFAADTPAAPPARVVVAKLMEKEVAETTQMVGTLYFERTSWLSTEVGGLVASIHFKEGDVVKSGEVLLELNTDFIDNEIQSVLARMEQINVRLAKAQKDVGRYETLFQKDAVSEMDYDDIVLARENLMKENIILEKSLALAKLKKHKSVIRAPFSGIVLEKKTELGNWVSAGSDFCLLASSTDLFVKVAVSETLFRYAKPGEKMEVIIKSLGKTVDGVVEGHLPVADPQTKNIFIKIRLPALEQAVLNMSATVFFPVSSRKRMLLIPRDALVTFNGNTLVYTIKDGKAEPVPVSIVTYVGGYAAVGQGPAVNGMLVVVDGNNRLRPGQPVMIMER